MEEHFFFGSSKVVFPPLDLDWCEPVHPTELTFLSYIMDNLWTISICPRIQDEWYLLAPLVMSPIVFRFNTLYWCLSPLSRSSVPSLSSGKQSSKYVEININLPGGLPLVSSLLSTYWQLRTFLNRTTLNISVLHSIKATYGNGVINTNITIIIC